jgi:hypothetical protein
MAGHRLRRHVRTVWESRGGGFYGFIAAGSFLYMEATDVVADVFELARIGLNLGNLIGFVVNNLVEAVLFVVSAALWPLWWMQHFGLGVPSLALLLLGYVVYRAIRPAVQRWLDEPDPDPSMDGPASTMSPAD